jgi:hypothetical protein
VPPGFSPNWPTFGANDVDFLAALSEVAAGRAPERKGFSPRLPRDWGGGLAQGATAGTGNNAEMGENDLAAWIPPRWWSVESKESADPVELSAAGKAISAAGGGRGSAVGTSESPGLGVAAMVNWM